MKAVFARTCALVLMASLAGCATSRSDPGRDGVEVTRFHLGQQVARGAIAIEPVNPADANSIEFRTYAAAVAEELRRLGWTVVNTIGTSEQVALINVEQGTREALARRSPVSVGIGGGTGGWGSGVGLGASIGLGGGRQRDVIATMLSVRIKRRSEGTVFWEGRATSEASAGTPAADRTVAVQMLAEALFRDFPGESGRTIRIQ